MNKSRQDDDAAYSEQEAEQRFKVIALAVLTTPPKPRKEIPRQRPYKPRKRKAASARE
jgi:hypothetical protein